MDIDYLPYSIRQSSQSWDIAETPEEEVELLVRWIRLVEVAENLPDCLYLLLGKNPSSEIMEEIKSLLQIFYPSDWEDRFTSFESMDGVKRIDFLKNFIRACLSELKEVETKDIALIRKGFLVRNEEMVKTIFSSLDSYQRLWVIAGEAHGRYLHSLEEKAVTHLYDSLEARNIHYVTLKYFKEDGGKYAYLNDRKLIPFMEKEEEENFQIVRDFQRKVFDNGFPHGKVPVFQFLALCDIIEGQQKNTLTADKLPERGYNCQLILEAILKW